MKAKQITGVLMGVLEGIFSHDFLDFNLVSETLCLSLGEGLVHLPVYVLLVRFFWNSTPRSAKSIFR